jgi:hypothetical protein
MLWVGIIADIILQRNGKSELSPTDGLVILTVDNILVCGQTRLVWMIKYAKTGLMPSCPHF